MSGTEEGEVGYCRPPVHSRFQKGGIGGNRPGRRKNQPIDLDAMLNEPVSVQVGGRKGKKHPFEVEFANLLKRAIMGELAAAKAVLKHFREAGLLDPPAHEHQYFYTVPMEWNYAEWNAMFDAHGPPPWAGPHDGLVPEYRRATHPGGLE